MIRARIGEFMRRLSTVAIPLLIVLAIAVWRAAGPEPRGPATPAAAFSSARAMTVLQKVIAPERPHPIGSEANRATRARIETHLRSLGYDVQLQRRFACNASASCGMVENVIARAPGSRREDAVLVVAHYDSVAASPGASDDAMGVATLLEVARAVRDERFRNPVTFLIDDGEEAGLLGAEAFVADATLAREIGVVVNVENRGTWGASNLFETSRGNRWLIRHLAPAIAQPQASSLFYEIYNLLPNDTDVTVFKRAGKAAVNFAAIRGVNWYHTPFDDLEHASRRTIQHHGDNVLASVRALARADLAARSRVDAVYFDLLGFLLVWWPEPWTLWIAIASLILLMFAARKKTARDMTVGVLSVFASLLLAGLAGAGVAWLARLGSEDVTWVAQPAPAVIALWLAGLAGGVLGATISGKRDRQAIIYGVAIVWHASAIALALTIPGASFLFLVPAAIVTLCAITRLNDLATATLASTAAAILFFPVALLLYDALGASLLIAIALVIGIFATLGAPVLARVSGAIVLLVMSVASAGIAALLAPTSLEKPAQISISYIDDATLGAAQWVTSELTPEIAGTARFTRGDRSLTPWRRQADWISPAARNLVAPVLLSGTRTATGVTIRLRSQRNAGRLTLAFRSSADAKVISVNGVNLPPRPARFRERGIGGWRTVRANAVDEMVVEIGTRGRVEAVASDVTFGLPAEGDALARARALSIAIPVQDGDTTVTRSRGTI